MKNCFPVNPMWCTNPRARGKRRRCSPRLKGNVTGFTTWSHKHKRIRKLWPMKNRCGNGIVLKEEKKKATYDFQSSWRTAACRADTDGNSWSRRESTSTWTNRAERRERTSLIIASNAADCELFQRAKFIICFFLFDDDELKVRHNQQFSATFASWWHDGTRQIEKGQRWERTHKKKEEEADVVRLLRRRLSASI